MTHPQKKNRIGFSFFFINPRILPAKEKDPPQKAGLF